MGLTFDKLSSEFLMNKGVDNYSYENGGKRIRFVKVHLAKPVKALYCVKDYSYTDESDKFHQVNVVDPALMFIGIIIDDCQFYYNSLLTFLSYIEDHPDCLQSMSSLENEMYTQLRREAMNCLEPEQLPTLGKKQLEDAQKDAIQAFMCDTTPEAYLYEIANPQNRNELIFGYVSHEKDWVKKLVAEKLPECKSKCLREIARVKYAEQYLEELKANKESPLFTYKAMKDAIGNRDCFLLVDCEQKNGNNAQLVVWSGCFSNQYSKDYSVIPSLQVVFQSQKKRSFPKRINKETIAKISVRDTGEVLWSRT